MKKPFVLVVASVGLFAFACGGGDDVTFSSSTAAGGSGTGGQGTGTGGAGPSTCGDGNLDLANNEECDDSNTAAGDGCSPSCQLEPVGQSCGNGTTESNEVCDDSNTANGDGCNPTCNLRGDSSLFVGAPGQMGTMDGVGMAARLGGSGVLTANATHLFLGDGSAVRQIEIATATVQTIAGGPTMGYTDNPTGTNAQFNNVGAITTDGATLWVADGGNRVIRAISTTPPYAVTTAVGSGTQGHMDGTGGAVQFDDLRGLTYYNGFVYLLDANAATLRRYDPATGEVITLAGTAYMTGQADGMGTVARFISPRYMASDGTGNLYIADTNGNKIRSYNTVTTEVKTFAGTGSCGYADGAGAMAQVHRPRGMTSDSTSIYWVEFDAHTIRQAVIATTDVSTLAGTPLGCATTCSCTMNPGGYMEGMGATSQWRHPFSTVFHFPTRSLFVLDGGNFVIRRIQ